MKTKIIVVSLLTLVQSSFPVTDQNVPKSAPPHYKPSLFYPVYDHINTRTATQFTIGLLVNGFSQNNYKHKLIANGIGLTYGLLAHMLLNKNINQAEHKGAPSPAEEQKSVFNSTFTDNLKSSVISYGVGATTGIGMRALFDKATQWFVQRRLAQQQRTDNLAAVQSILGSDYLRPSRLADTTDVLSDYNVRRMYRGKKRDMEKLLRLECKRRDNFPEVSKNAWNSFMSKDLATMELLKGAYTISQETWTITQAWFDDWKKFVVANLQQATQHVRRSKLKGIISSETIATIKNNKTLVDEVIKKMRDATK